MSIQEVNNGKILYQFTWCYNFSNFSKTSQRKESKFRIGTTRSFVISRNN